MSYFGFRNSIAVGVGGIIPLNSGSGSNMRRTMTVLSSSNTPYVTSLNVLSSDGTSYTVTKSVLNSAGTAYTVV